MGRPDALAAFIERVRPTDYPAVEVRPDPLRPRRSLVRRLRRHRPAVDLGADRSPTCAPGSSPACSAASIDRFEFIDHDSCLMSAYEAASALGPLAEVVVGSEEVDLRGPHAGSAPRSPAWVRASPARSGAGPTSRGSDRCRQLTGRIGDFVALSVVDGDAMARLDEAVESFADVAIAQHGRDRSRDRPGARSRRWSSSPDCSGRRRAAATASSTSVTSCASSRTFPSEVEVARDAVYAALDARRSCTR